MPTEIEGLYHKWLEAERAALASDEDDEGPLNDEVNRLADALLAAPITCERDALCVMAARASWSAMYDDDPQPAPPGTVARLFEGLGIPLRNR